MARKVKDYSLEENFINAVKNLQEKLNNGAIAEIETSKLILHIANNCIRIMEAGKPSFVSPNMHFLFGICNSNRIEVEVLNKLN